MAGPKAPPHIISVLYNHCHITLAGTRWSADWSIWGEEIVVRSAYGSAQRKLGRRKPELLAKDLLMEILVAKLKSCEEARVGPERQVEPVCRSLARAEGAGLHVERGDRALSPRRRARAPDLAAREVPGDPMAI